MNDTKVELLSPAGSYDSFLAAVSAGADAVYLALNRFGARANATNLTVDELIEALDIAHIFGKKIYLTVNTLFKDNEIGELHDFLYEPYIHGLDGVIVQDIGVMSKIRELYPDLPVHASTQAAITSSDGAFYLKSLGIKRIVPARELSLDEIRRMKAETGLELECFIHGSMCYSYSGKCLLSSFIGGRSGNRGRCAQPCRLMYEGKYPLSLKDMCTIDILPRLIDAGISSFKIEGRMKSSEYVYSVTSLYRKYIDIYYSSAEYKVDEDDRARLISLYTRSGNCDGYYFRHNSRKMITPVSPSYISNSDSSDMEFKTSFPTVDVNVKCTIRCGQNAIISVSDKYRTVDTVTGVIAEKAANRALTGDEIITSLKKSGGTLFNVRECNIEYDDDIFLPKSKLNEIRREGLEAFRSSCARSFYRTDDRVQDLVFHKRPNVKRDRSEPVKTVASILNNKQLLPVIKSSVDRVVIPMGIFDECMRNMPDMGNKELYAALPYVVREDNRSNSRRAIVDFVKKAVDIYGVDGFYVSNLESANILSDICSGCKTVADVFMYAYNYEAYDFYIRNGIDTTTVPLELNEKELVQRGIIGEELMVYGRVPVMVSANCTYNTLFGCNPNKGDSMYLTDRKGERLYVNRNCSECTNVIYNSVRTCITDEEKLFESIRPSSVRFCFTDEDKDEVAGILDKYFALMNHNGSTSGRLLEKYTKGHLKRGVM